MSWGNRNSRRSGNGSWWAWLIIGWLVFNALVGASSTALIMFLTIGLLFAVFYGLTRLSSGAQTTQTQRQQRQTPRAEPANRRATWEDEYEDLEDLALRLSDYPKSVAERALRRAGNRPDSWQLSLDDIGLLAYHGDASPDVVRQNPVTEDTTHLRPFVVIHLPYKQGRGTIRFELFDETGQKRFESAEVYQLKGGPNFITPRRWLPMNDARSAGRWSMRVSIGGGKLLAIHEFRVNEPYSGQMRQFLREDGEIDPWLGRAIAEQSTQETMSLDELLASAGADELETKSNRLR